MFYLVIAVIACVFLYYTFQKYMELKKTYAYMLSLHSKQKEEMTQLNEKVNDLQVYKDDVSKTFKLLDNELKLITENTQNALVMNNRMNNLQLTTAPAQHQHPLTTLLRTIIPPMAPIQPSSQFNQQQTNFQTYTPDASQFRFSYDLPQQTSGFTAQSSQQQVRNENNYMVNTNREEEFSGDSIIEVREETIEPIQVEKEESEEEKNTEVNVKLSEVNNEANVKSPEVNTEANVKLQSTIDEVKENDTLSGVSFSNIDLNEEDLSSHLKNSALIFMDKKINPSSEFEKFLI